MKTNGNGGYQIIDFEGQAPNTLDVDLFGNAIARGKPLWVNNLVVDGETYCGVASVKKTLTHLILVLATIQIVIALSDGATTYEQESSGLEVLPTIEFTGNISDMDVDDPETLTITTIITDAIKNKLADVTKNYIIDIVTGDFSHIYFTSSNTLITTLYIIRTLVFYNYDSNKVYVFKLEINKETNSTSLALVGLMDEL
ncbi:MAG: hypothetical protein J6S85_06150 [Methanobrevibacter sp.]|nr:hypothetical protein [Methanobrevibacter sp.]